MNSELLKTLVDTMIEAWAKAEPSNDTVKYPASYYASWVDVAKAVGALIDDLVAVSEAESRKLRETVDRVAALADSIEAADDCLTPNKHIPPLIRSTIKGPELGAAEEAAIDGAQAAPKARLMSKRQLDAIYERAGRATEGPWEVRACKPLKPDVLGIFRPEHSCGDDFWPITGWMPLARMADVIFMANARQDITDLLAENEYLRQALDRARYVAEGWELRGGYDMGNAGTLPDDVGIPLRESSAGLIKCARELRDAIKVEP